ncbi:MAG: hypothetical protein KGJ57_17355 [Sphingomonadales bacterium]|nr:hypothetical protein [Sphingomonadales bacterium]MDE2171165.1 hypothetical protein [Sphingomonadales bacterium]
MADPVTTRPTRLAERTLICALAALCLFALIFAGTLLFPAWPAAVAAQRIHYLGSALILAVLGILVMIIALASPWLGSVRVTAPGASIDINGDGKNGND